ncbi:arginase family protein [Microbacterium sp. NPDC058342]|uniref:arginase family protein n=1 Tax=Microbacterium sp. NPDC058342 TaxID=3346454 RepID=UPI00365D2750
MSQHIDVIISQGRVGDRTDGALPGALKAGTGLAALLAVEPRIIGTPSASTTDDWSVSLPAASETLTQLRDALRLSLDAGRLPVLATNTCGASIGTLPTVAERFPEAVVLWIDAHGDFNTPQTTGSGYLGGMVLLPGAPALSRAPPRALSVSGGACAPDRVPSGCGCVCARRRSSSCRWPTAAPA